MAATTTEARGGMRPSRHVKALGTYASRPILRWLAAGVVVFTLWYLVSGECHFLRREPLFRIPIFRDFWRLSEVAMGPLMILLPVTAAAAVTRHAREQIAFARASLVPRSCAPAVVAAAVALGIVLAATTLLMSDQFLFDSDWASRGSHRESSFLGALDLALVLVAASAWWGFVARSPWTTVLFACVVLTALVEGLGRAAEWLVERWVYDVTWYAQRYPKIDLGPELRAQSLRTAVREWLFAANVAALAALAWRLAVTGRPGPRRASAPFLDGAIAPVEASQTGRDPIVEPSPHRPLRGSWKRTLQRRRASPLGTAAPWVLGGVVALLSTLLTMLNHAIAAASRPPEHHSGGQTVMRALLLATVVPAIAAAGAWRARQAALAYESLFPAGRADFAGETSAALAADLLAYWLACAAGAMASIALMAPNWLTSPLLGAGLIASAATQSLALAGLLLAARARPVAAHVLGPAATVLVGTALFTALWHREWFPDPSAVPIQASAVLAGSAATSALGGLLSIIGVRNWRRAELA